MNTREEILDAIEDYQRGRLGIIPADQLAPRDFGEHRRAASEEHST